jgi:hypothetical protein
MPTHAKRIPRLRTAQVNNRHMYAQASKDKLLLALCVLTLMAGDFEVKFDELAADLKMHCDK